jgi:hypothetical protein
MAYLLVEADWRSANANETNVIRRLARPAGRISYRGVVSQQPGRDPPGPLRRVSRRVRRAPAYRAAGRLGRRSSAAFSRRIRLGTAGTSPRLRRWVLAVVVIGVALVPYPVLSGAGGTPAAACRPGCRSGPVTSMIRWTRPLPGAWQVIGGLTGTVPVSGLAYVSTGSGLAAVGAGLTVSAYSSATGAPLWTDTLTGFPPGAAIVSVRTWPGVITAGVSYREAGSVRRTEVVMTGSTGIQSGRYPAAPFGGAVGASPQYTVIVGSTAVTSYDNATGRVRWTVPTGPVAQAWHTDGSLLYVAESAGGFLASSPVTAVRQINLSTGAQLLVGPLGGPSFDGSFSAASGGVLLFSSAAGVTAYGAGSGARLWFVQGAVPEGSDPLDQRIYLTRGTDLIAVKPLNGQVTATVAGAPGVYVVRGGVALGFDQGAGGDAWGYSIATQRVTLAAANLPWPHYFTDPGGIGGSAAPAGRLVLIAACAKLGPQTPASPSPTATTSSPAPSPSAPTASTSPATPPAVQNCLQPELVALTL